MRNRSTKSGDPPSPRHIEMPAHRREDDRLITGRGRFTADIELENALHVSFVRSPVAAGRITTCNLDEAIGHAGVSAAFCGRHVAHLRDLAVNPVLGPVETVEFPVLAHEHVSAVGQPVAAVFADSQETAQDAAELVVIDVAEPDTAEYLDPVSANFIEHSSFANQWRQGNPEQAFNEADHIVEATVQHPRISPSPMENRSIAVHYDEHNESVIVWLSTQTPHRARKGLSHILDRNIGRIRVIAPDVGGAFGLKASLYPEEVLVVWAAFELRRSITWSATRSEDLLSASHGRGLSTRGSLAVSSDGIFLGLKAEVRAPLGSWHTNSAAIPAWNAARILPGPYDLGSFDLRTTGVRTNTAPVGICRGAGRPEAAMLMERLVEDAARALDMDPIELRRRNLLRSSQLPCKRETGVLLDSGDYPAALDLLLASSAYSSARAEQQKRRASGEIVGIGASFFVEPCGTGWESAAVRLDPDGSVIVRTGASSQGHGRETAYAQIAANVLGCPVEHVAVLHGDTLACPDGIGALASRSTAIGGSAVAQAASEALARSGGSLTPDEAIEVSLNYEADGEAWGYGCYIAQITIDAETGVLKVEKMTCLDDAGTVINPQMVAGQIRGGIAQGIGEVMLECLVYDEEGQLLTGSLMDYALPRAADMPEIELVHMHTPSPANRLGAKGVGEAGTIGAPAAIYNAAIDALSPSGVRSLPLPLSSNSIWQSLCSGGAHSEESETQ